MGEVQVPFFAQPPLGANAEAVAHDQHANKQLGIDRRAADAAVEGRQMPVQLTQIKNPSDAPYLVVGWNVSFEIEGVEQLVVSPALSSHHLDVPPKTTDVL